MILVDTSVISEPMRPAPDPRVIEWLGAQALETLYLNTIVVAELRFGAWSLPRGRRRNRLLDDIERQVLPMFAGRVLVFDMAASQAYAQLMARARMSGRAISVTDGYIAAIAVANGMKMATRDTAPFEASGLEVVDPWAA